MKKIIAIALTCAMLLSVAGCSQNNDSGNDGTSTTSQAADTDNNGGESTSENTGDDTTGGEEDPNGGDSEPIEMIGPFADMTYSEASTKIYNDNLGDFKAALDIATAVVDDLSKRYALMAVAEAKLLEAGVFIPLKANGGAYAINRLASYTNSPVMWGTDNYRFYQNLITTDFITAADRDEMKVKYNELKGSGEYLAWAKQYLIDKGYELKDEKSVYYSADLTTWDVLATNEADNSELLVQTYDGLLEYDCENVQQPALAESYEVSEDGLTYTFHLRQGVKWVDSQGREVADLTADDFVAGMQHAFDAKSGTEGLLRDLIVGVGEYIDGNDLNFDNVGVKAVDEYTVKYTLQQVAPYFASMTGYGIFAPMSRSYFESQGGKFGAEFEQVKDTDAYKYGKDQNSIAYCGPFLVTNATSKNSMTLEANPSYWNKDALNIHKQNWRYTESTDPKTSYDDAINGFVDGVGLDESTITMAKEAATDDGSNIFDKYHYTSLTDSTTYGGFLNLNRQQFVNPNDQVKMPSQKTEQQKVDYITAAQNVHFRLAVYFALDRGNQNAQLRGEDLKYNSLRNTYTPGNMVMLLEDTTISINGTDTTFEAGTNYGKIVQAQLTADGFKAKVYDEATDSTDGFDGWYNPENAKAELAIAIEELKAQGLEISKENPIYLDYPVAAQVPQFKQGAYVIKQSVEEALDGCVIINVIEGSSYDDRNYAMFYPETGLEMNFDFMDAAGWGPDYGDPMSFLNTMLPDYNGDCTKYVGIY